MSYISAKDVQAIRKELKAAYPNLKFRVRKDRCSAVYVTIVSGDIDFSDIFTDEGYAQINQYHLGNYGVHQQMFQNIVDIVKTAPARGEGYWKDRGWYDNSDSMSDYFDTAYYFYISVGSWNAPYVLNAEGQRKSTKIRIPDEVNVEAARAVASKETTVQDLLASVGIDARVLLGEDKANMRVIG